MKAPVWAPPAIELDGDISWLLRAAFTDGSARAESFPVDSPRALRLARDTDMSGRIGSKRLRLEPSTPEVRELGRELAADYHRNVARELLEGQTLAQVLDVSNRLGVPVIALKSAALRQAGIVAPGTRSFCDLDLLVSETEAKIVWRALLDAGFSRTGTSEFSHQLEPLVDPYGGFVDLHVHIPGVFVRKGRGATASQLIERALVRPVTSSVLVPNEALMAAHAIAHALIQNQSTPQSYSPLRMVADVIDLRRVDPKVLSSAANFLRPELGTACDTLEHLCAALTNGTFQGAQFEGTAEQTLLRHCLAARIDFEYSERLRAAGLVNKLRDGSSAREIVQYVVHLLYPGEAELETLYGSAHGLLGKMRRRLVRPIDLVVRTLRRRGHSRSRRRN